MIDKLLLPLFLVCLIATANGQKANTDKRGVAAAFKNYKRAILHDDGEAAIGFLDARTILYYEKILDHVKRTDSTRLNKLILLDRVIIVGIRHHATREEILSFDAKSLLTFAIRKGMIGKTSVTGASIGPVEIEGTTAKGLLVVNRKKTNVKLLFYFEDGGWKLNLTSLFPTTNMSFRQLVKESKKSENDYILTLLKNQSGKTPAPSIWLPVN